MGKVGLEKTSQEFCTNGESMCLSRGPGRQGRDDVFVIIQIKHPSLSAEVMCSICLTACASHPQYSSSANSPLSLAIYRAEDFTDRN